MSTAEQDLMDIGKIRERIVHILSIYPVINGTMLQGALGPYTKAGNWRPALDELIEEGIVLREHTDQILTPAGRYNSYELLRLRSVRASAEHACHQIIRECDTSTADGEPWDTFKDIALIGLGKPFNDIDHE